METMNCSIKDLQPYQRPREKCALLGAEHLEIEELVAILLRTGCKGESALALSRRLIEYFPNGLYELQHISVRELQEIKGIGQDKAVTLCAAIELGKRLREMRILQECIDFSDPAVVAQYVMERLRHQRVEQMWVAFLTCRNQLIRMEMVAQGALSSCVVEQREVFRKALVCNAGHLILIHNHPSGASSPSRRDVEMTRQFIRAGEVMGIDVLDHVIIGDGEYTSLVEGGYI